jgi:hypothetical protein
VEVVRLDPAIDAIVPLNPKIFKLAEGFQFTEGPIWLKNGDFLFSDPNANKIYKYAANGTLSVFKNNSGYFGRASSLTVLMISSTAPMERFSSPIRHLACRNSTTIRAKSSPIAASSLFIETSSSSLART